MSQQVIILMGEFVFNDEVHWVHDTLSVAPGCPTRRRHNANTHVGTSGYVLSMFSNGSLNLGGPSLLNPNVKYNNGKNIARAT